MLHVVAGMGSRAVQFAVLVYVLRGQAALQGKAVFARTVHSCPQQTDSTRVDVHISFKPR